MLKRIIALILAILMIFAVVSCNSKAVENNENKDLLVSTEDSRYDPNLPDKDFGGVDFTFAVRGEEGDPYKWNGTDIVSEYTGEIIGDSIYKRNMYLKEKYNVTINVYFAGNTSVYTSGSDMYNKIQAAVASGDSEFDAILTSPYDTAGYILAGFVNDLNEVPYIDFQREWWDHNVIKSLNILGKTYAATGSLTIIDDKATHAFIFNKNLIEKLHLDDPYTVVKNGEWTIEKLITDSRIATFEVDGDGKMTEKDSYGFHYWQDASFTFLCSTGNSFGKINSIGLPELTLNTPKTIDVWETIIDFVKSDSAFTPNDFYQIDNTDLLTMLSDDRVLYGWTTISDIIDLRKSFEDFGIIPAPKYDVSQENYITSPHTFANTLLTIPITNKNIENTGFILEAFSAKSAELMTPALYENVLKGRTAMDKESADMLDIIFSTKYYDIGLFFMWGDYGNVMMDAFNEKNKNFVTEYIKHEKVALNDVQKLIDCILLQ